jgi:hypothetical protein
MIPTLLVELKIYEFQKIICENFIEYGGRDGEEE